MTDKARKNTKGSRGLSVDIEHMSITGHAAFAGRDASIQVNTGGNVAQNSENTITVGGVETTQKEHDKLASKIEAVQQQFEREETDEETKEAARHYIETIKKLLLGKNKPNPKILISTVKSISKLGPIFAIGIAQVFGEPLASKIISELASATGFFTAFMQNFAS